MLPNISSRRTTLSTVLLERPSAIPQIPPIIVNRFRNVTPTKKVKMRHVNSERIRGRNKSEPILGIK